MDDQEGTSASVADTTTIIDVENDSASADASMVSITTIPETSTSSDDPTRQVSSDDDNNNTMQSKRSLVAVPTRQVSTDDSINMAQSEGSLVGVIAQPVSDNQSSQAPVPMLEIPINRSNDKIVMV